MSAIHLNTPVPVGTRIPKAGRAPEQLSEGPGVLRRGLEAAGGAVSAAIHSVGAVLPGFVAGGIDGVDRHMDARDVAQAHAFVTGAQLALGGAVAGGMLLGGWGILGGLAAGSVAGLLVGGLQSASGASEKIGEGIHQRVERAVSDNSPSGSPVKDASKDFTEGAVWGALEGFKGGASTGYSQGRGVVSGLIEGVKDGARTLVGRFDPEGAPPDPSAVKQRGMTSRILRLPFYALAGTAAGVTGMALSALDGVVQGLGHGVDGVEDLEHAGSRSLHRNLVRLQSTAAGAAVGGMTFGPWGIAAGAAAGLLAGSVIARIERKGGADGEIVRATASAVKGAQENNGRSQDEIADRYRNAVEGALVGGVAAARAGFKAGFRGGVGVVDGVADAIGGVFAGIAGAVTGK